MLLVASKEANGENELHGEAHEGSVRLPTASFHSSKTDDAWAPFLRADVDGARIGWCDRLREAFSCCGMISCDEIERVGRSVMGWMAAGLIFV